MRSKTIPLMAFAAVLPMTAFGSWTSAALTAFAVPAAPSASAWTSIDSGWTAPFTVLNDPFVTYQTGLNGWRMWGSTDTSVFPTVLHGATIGRRLSTEMTSGQTFDFGIDARAGGLRLGNIYPNNATMSVGFGFGPGFLHYEYSDNDNSGIDTGIAIGTPIDVKITWVDSVSQAYTGAVTVIGNATPSFTWNGTFRGTSGPDLSDLSNHINGFQASNFGSSTDYFGLKYIEVGSGTLPDPATLVPEPSFFAMLPLVVAGALTRTRRNRISYRSDRITLHTTTNHGPKLERSINDKRHRSSSGRRRETEEGSGRTQTRVKA